MYAVGQSRPARRRGDEKKLLPPMRCGTGKGQVAGCGVAPTDSYITGSDHMVYNDVDEYDDD
jgi:hypothetical protein